MCFCLNFLGAVTINTKFYVENKFKHSPGPQCQTRCNCKGDVHYTTTGTDMHEILYGGQRQVDSRRLGTPRKNEIKRSLLLCHDWYCWSKHLSNNTMSKCLKEMSPFMGKSSPTAPLQGEDIIGAVWLPPGFFVCHTCTTHKEFRASTVQRKEDRQH